MMSYWSSEKESRNLQVKPVMLVIVVNEFDMVMVSRTRDARRSRSSDRFTK